MRSIAMRHVWLCLTAPTQSTTETCLVSKSWSSWGTKTEHKPNNRQHEPWREKRYKSQKNCSNKKLKQTMYIGTQILSAYCTIDIARTQNEKKISFWRYSKDFTFYRRWCFLEPQHPHSHFLFRRFFPMFSKHHFVWSIKLLWLCSNYSFKPCISGISMTKKSYLISLGSIIPTNLLWHVLKVKCRGNLNQFSQGALIACCLEGDWQE